MKIIFIFSLIFSITSFCGDWPTFRHDLLRSSKCNENFFYGEIEQKWCVKSSMAPQTAWHGPAKWDAYINLKELSAMRNYDTVFHSVVVGQRVLFASSVDDSIHCVDLKSGKHIWHYTTDAPIHIVPTIANNKVYFGSDDGRVYCVNLSDGSLKWSYRPKTGAHLVFNNGRLVSTFPCRTGVTIHKNIAYCGFSMLPWKPAYLCALNSDTGKPYYVKKHNNTTMEAPFAYSAGRLIIPRGRVSPGIYDARNGNVLQSLQKVTGGCFVLVTEDNHIISGPGHNSGNRVGGIFDSSTKGPAKVVAHGKARIILVDKGWLFGSDSNTVFCKSRKTGKKMWSAKQNGINAMVICPRVVVCGGIDEVMAFDRKTGSVVWQVEVNGKADGLTIANGRLIVSTDTGDIICFAPNVKKMVTISSNLKSKVKKNENIGRWVFSRKNLLNNGLRDLSNNSNISFSNMPRFIKMGKLEALEISSKDVVLITDDIKEAVLPKKEFTVAAWVNMERFSDWGGIIGAFQDNGEAEFGWLLGHRKNQFTIALSSKGNKKLTYLASKIASNTKQWYHVSATYDGSHLRLFVDGVQVAENSVHSGDIYYPAAAYYEIGSYHDKNENMPMNGRILMVEVYNYAQSAQIIKQKFTKAKKYIPTTTMPYPGKSLALPSNYIPKSNKKAELALQPIVKHIDDKTAQIEWETYESTTSCVNLIYHNNKQTFTNNIKTTKHKITIPIKHRRIYEYQIIVPTGRGNGVTKIFELDSMFNFSLQSINKPFKSTPNSLKGIAVLQATKIDRGMALVVGDTDGELALSLICNSKLRVIVLDDNSDNVKKLRKKFIALGAYGSRISIHKINNYSKLPIPANSINLITTGLSQLPTTITLKQLALYLKESSGKIAIPKHDGSIAGTTLIKEQIEDLSIISKPKFAGSANWSHQYGEADNSAFAGEALGGVRKTSDLELRWIGRPGPRFQADRSGRKPGPLSTAGKLFAQGLERIVAIDAHNGTISWSREIHGFNRFNIPRDCGNWCADDDFVYALVDDTCLKLNTLNGALTGVLKLPKDMSQDNNWGYIAQNSSMILGSTVRKGIQFHNFWGGGGAGWYDSKTGLPVQHICSDSIFAVNKKSSKTAWLYQKGLIINPTITMKDGHLYFLESRNLKLLNSKNRRLNWGTGLGENLYLVALDTKTGEKIYETQINISAKVMINMACSNNGFMVIVGSSDGNFNVQCLSSKTGSLEWTKQLKWSRDNHGWHMCRPLILGNRLFIRPFALDLASGVQISQKVALGGCGTYAASTNMLLYRSGDLRCYDVESQANSSWNKLRPGCWLSTIPAQGMILSPEAGGGCSCGGWFEASAGFAPKKYPSILFGSSESIFYKNMTINLISQKNRGVIHYTIDGSKPTIASTIFTKPFSINEDRIVQAGLFKNNELISKILKKEYKRQYLPVKLHTIFSRFCDKIVVSVTSPSVDATIHYTTDGKIPTANSAKTKREITINKSCILKVIAIYPNGRSSTAITHKFTKVNGKPKSGLMASEYRKKVNLLPDFNKLKAVKNYISAQAKLRDDFPKTNIIVKFDGFIKIEKAGKYQFFTKSDDGSACWVRDKLVVNNDGLHGAIEKSGTIELKPGIYPIRIAFFQINGGMYFDCHWSGPGITKQPIPQNILFH